MALQLTGSTARGFTDSPARERFGTSGSARPPAAGLEGADRGGEWHHRGLGGPLFRLFHTLRWLPAAQIAALVRHRLRAVFERSSPPFLASGDLPRCSWNADDFVAPGSRPQDPAELAAGRLRFLNRSEAVGWPPSRWQDPAWPRLWAYNLHYFDYLWDLDWAAGRAGVEDWIERHRPGRGGTGWEPYPTSLRLLNWVGYFYGRNRAVLEAHADFERHLAASITAQAEYLTRHLEFHLQGNHLLENAVALAFCGACFAGEAPARWLEQGITLLEEQLPEQVLPDGVHFERSPMYQLRIAYGLRCLRDTGHPRLVELVSEPLARMISALGHMCHPDGEIALLNDAAFGVYNTPQDLGAEPGLGSFALQHAGYFGAATSEGHYIICDAAPIGPDYLPGHAHADLLSFELSLAGQRVLVDAGVHGYEADALRRWCRSTRAHNTVEIDGEDQCEMWSAFRVARRGHPQDVRFEAAERGFLLEASHDGYRRLAGRPIHRRRFRWHDDGVLLVHDAVEADRPVVAVSRLHLHPACELLELGDDAARIGYPAGEFRIRFAGEGVLTSEPSTYHPEFNLVEEGRALVFSARGPQLHFGFCVANQAGNLDFSLVSGARRDGRSYGW